MPPVARLTDMCTGHGAFPPRNDDSGSGNVFVNGLPVHRVGDHWVTHSAPNQGSHDGQLAAGAPHVFANGMQIGRIGDPVSCGSKIASGSGNVFAGDTGSSSGGTPALPPRQSEAELAMADLEDEGPQPLRIWPPVRGKPTTEQIRQSIANGRNPNAPPPIPQASDPAVPPPSTPPPVDCESLDDPLVPSSKISENFTLAQLTKRIPSGTHELIDQHGLTKRQIACNLKNLCDNILEPLSARGFQFTVNSAFRQGSGTSQHERGDAADLHFSTTKNGYFEVAKQIRDSGLPFGQLILEFVGGSTWIHISGRESKNTIADPGLKVATMDPNGGFHKGLSLYS